LSELALEGLFLSFDTHSIGDVHRDDDGGLAMVELDPLPRDLDEDRLARARLRQPRPAGAKNASVARCRLLDLRLVFRPDQIGDLHLEELVSRVLVLRQGRVVRCEEPKTVPLVDPHG
jgi:hypothetical protein